MGEEGERGTDRSGEGGRGGGNIRAGEGGKVDTGRSGGVRVGGRERHWQGG